MYRTAVASLRVAAPRRTFLTSRPAAKDLNHQVGDTLKAGKSIHLSPFVISPVCPN